MNAVSQNYPRQHQPSPHHVILPTSTATPPTSSSPNPANNSRTISVIGVPSVHISNNRLVVGSASSSSTRSYTPLKVLGDGSFGTVWLCDWHGTLPPNTPLSPMQCGAGARPEWVGKRLVAVKRMKKRWEGGWDECQQLKELEASLNLQSLVNQLTGDFKLYFVFESMEGNLYHLIKARKGRPLAGGLVASIFFQITSGLSHIHTSGYFHRDMKPENVLVTTTGLFDYTPLSPDTSSVEKDVVAIIKLADFGLARETKSKPPYTEYVSTRWYRAPEVLLLSRDYSNPVDMWALGTIMAELVNLRPLFPGAEQVDQIAKICQVLGNPCDDYGLDQSGGQLGGGPWPKGLEIAQQVGFEFRRMVPQDIHNLFDRSIPISLVHCIRDLLRFDPKARLTSQQCLHHRYLAESLPRNDIPLPPGVRLATTPQVSQLQIPNVTVSHRSAFFPSNSPSPSPSPGPAYSRPTRAVWEPNVNGGAGEPMDISPQTDSPPFPIPNVLGDSVSQIHNSNSAKLSGKFSGFGKKLGLGRFGSTSDKHTHHELPPVHEIPAGTIGASSSTGSLGLKRTQSAGSGSAEMSSPVQLRPDELKRLKDRDRDNKKEAERLHREAEKQRRALAERMQREQARAVMQKRNLILQNSTSAKEAPFIEWRNGGNEQPTVPSQTSGPSSVAKGKQPMATMSGHGPGPIRTRTRDRDHLANGHGNPHSPRLHPPVAVPSSSEMSHLDWREGGSTTNGGERVTKLRRMDFDEDGSSVVSSSDVHSIGRKSSMSRMSTISFATVNSVDTVGSDPGPSRIRNRPSLLGLNRVTSTGTGTSSLRTSFDFPNAHPFTNTSSQVPEHPLHLHPLPNSYSQHHHHSHSPSHHSHSSSISARSARSSNSYSLDGQLAHDFRTQATMDSDVPVNGSVSPPPMQFLSLSPSLSPAHHSHSSPRPSPHPSPHHSQSSLSPSLLSMSPSLSPSLSPSPVPSRWGNTNSSGTTLPIISRDRESHSLPSRRGQVPPPQISILRTQRSGEYMSSPDVEGYQYHDPGIEGEFENYQDYDGYQEHSSGQGVPSSGHTTAQIFYHQNNHPPHNTNGIPDLRGIQAMRIKSSSEQIQINPIFKVPIPVSSSSSSSISTSISTPTTSSSFTKNQHYNYNTSPTSISSTSSLSSFLQPPLPTPTASDVTNGSFGDSIDTDTMEDSVVDEDSDVVSSPVSYAYSYTSSTYYKDPPDNLGNLDPRSIRLNSHSHSSTSNANGTSLPPFSELEAVAGAGFDYPPSSMSFTAPSEVQERENSNSR
ncbi:hypothetical protein D9757_002954 [Collybiopsis confluens]|uniref:Protein kinase domain-containing protein n=1 Tax=Collybiopsis confluens TaxID=2823264 RepID=A0A8H5HVR1_9AGAR|nr:hypothetical protein D9757_002954 [Collybiopsis confluens]